MSTESERAKRLVRAVFPEAHALDTGDRIYREWSICSQDRPPMDDPYVIGRSRNEEDAWINAAVLLPSLVKGDPGRKHNYLAALLVDAIDRIEALERRLDSRDDR